MKPIIVQLKLAYVSINDQVLVVRWLGMYVKQLYGRSMIPPKQQQVDPGMSFGGFEVSRYVSSTAARRCALLANPGATRSSTLSVNILKFGERRASTNAASREGALSMPCMTV
jgi:hypothetical protein